MPLHDELFVANLAPDTTESDIKELFAPYASVRECWVGQKKQLKGSAHTSFSSVRVETHAEALAARKALNGTLYKERNLIVKWAANHRLLWVGSLHDNVTNEALLAGFSQFGTVEHALVVADGNNPVSRRYGFVLFEERRDAQKALAKCEEGCLLFDKSPEPVRAAWAIVEEADDGYSDAVAGRKRHGEALPPVEARLAQAGTPEHALAMRIKALRMQYEQTKAQLKAQIAAALKAPPPMTQSVPNPMVPSGPMGMMAGRSQFMGGGPQGPMGPMAPPMQGSGPMGPMVGPLSPMGGMQGGMPSLGLGAAAGMVGMAPTPPQQPMTNQASQSKQGESFNSVPPPSKAQMRSNTQLTLPGAKPPGSHDHRGIGFSGAAGSAQSSQAGSQSTATPGPRPPPLPNTSYNSSASQMGGYAQATPAGTPSVPNYPPPGNTGAAAAAGVYGGMAAGGYGAMNAAGSYGAPNAATGGYGGGATGTGGSYGSGTPMGAYGAAATGGYGSAASSMAPMAAPSAMGGQMQGMGAVGAMGAMSNVQQQGMNMGMNYAAPPGQGGYQAGGMAGGMQGLGGYPAAAAAPMGGQMGMGGGMQAGYSTGGMVGNTTYAPPPQQY